MPEPISDALTTYTHADPEKHFIGETLPPPVTVAIGGPPTVGFSPFPAREDHFHGSGKEVGDVFMRATSTVPAFSLLLNGQAVSRITYAALFAIYSTTFGVGDGSTTFNLPNMSDRFPVGAGVTYGVNASGGSANQSVVDHGHPGSTASSSTSTSIVASTHQHDLTGASVVASVFGGGPSTHIVVRQNVYGSGVIAVSDPDGNGVGDTTFGANTVISGMAVNMTGSLQVNGTTFFDGSHGHGASSSTSTSVSIANAGSSGTNANLPPYRAMYFFVYAGA